MLFQNRKLAGQKLAQSIKHLSDNKNLIVLALPRGGVPVGFEIARILNAPLEADRFRRGLGAKVGESFCPLGFE